MRVGLAALVHAERVEKALAAEGVRSRTAGKLRLDRAWPTNDGGLVVLYRDRHSAGIEGAWAVISRAEGRIPGALRRKVRRARAAQLPGLEAFAFAFPHDPYLPDLERVLDPRTAVRALAPWLPQGADGTRALQPRALRYKPLRRCVIEYRVESGEGPPASLFCKTQRASNDVETRKIHLAIQRRLPSGNRLRIAHPIGSVDDWNMLVWSTATGRPVVDLVGQESSQRSLDLVAGALAELHRCAVKFSRDHTRTDELDTLGRWVRVAAASYPAIARDLIAAYTIVVQASPQVPLGRLVPSHRDFHQGQLLLGDNQAVLLDLDTAAMSEAELDVGNFLAHLRSDSGETATLRYARLAAVFRSAYAGETGLQLDPQRLAWYEASSLLRLACVHSFRPRRSGRIADLVASAVCLVDEIASERKVV